MITAQIEEFTRASIIEIEALVDNHAIEVSAHYKNGIPVNCNWPEYINRQLRGEFIYVTLREDAKLIGYFSTFIAPCFHYQAISVTLDAIYVNPDNRGVSGGLMMMQTMYNEFKRRGAKVWRMGYKVEHAKYMEALLDEFGRLNKVQFEPFEVHRMLWAKD
jgi:L-amino acid N-acyltransferase YncA